MPSHGHRGSISLLIHQLVPPRRPTQLSVALGFSHQLDWGRGSYPSLPTALLQSSD